MTERELRYGVTLQPDIARLQTIGDDSLIRLTIPSWDSEAAQQYYGQLRATLERQEQPVGNLDMMIGAQALWHWDSSS